VMHPRLPAAQLLIAVALVCSILLPRIPVAHAAGRPVRFGIDEGYLAPDLFSQSGATWDRIDFHWDAFQPTGPTDWKSNDQSTDADIARDLSDGISVVGVITNPPAWATRNGSVPSNLASPVTDPQNYWAAFVHQLASTYAGRIDDWIIWNEPDIDPSRPMSSWAGSEEEFYLLLKDASLAMKSANPSAKIIFAGTTYWNDILAGRKLFVERVLEAGDRIDPTAAANGYYFDAVDIHIYSSPYQIYSIPQAYRAALARFNLVKPIWISEMNVVPWDDPESTVPRGGFRASLDEQAAYMIEAVAMADAAGVERAAVYKMIDGTIIGGEPYGLVRNDLTARPAYRAFQTAMQYLDVQGTATLQSQGDARIVTIVNGEHRVTVAWSSTPTTIELPVAPQGTSAKLVTKLGQVTDLGLPTDPTQPDYVLHLAPATDNTDDSDRNDYIVGGDPLILVEDGVGEGVTLGSDTLYYPITGFTISGAFLDYFEHRGGLRQFGYPISRPFQLLGSQVQFFQRRVLQMMPGGSVGQLNLLDPGYMPYTRINNATFPAPDLALTHKLPTPGSKDYTKQVLQYVQATAPNQWNGAPVNFHTTFTSSVSLNEVFPTGHPQPSLLPGINLELWGVPTSEPAVDPNNHNFIYQRFQRGVMHYDRTTAVTQGLLLADYFKSIITGNGLPPDLNAEAQGSRYYRQYDPSQPHWVARPDQLPHTDLTFAFQRQAAPVGAAPAAVSAQAPVAGSPTPVAGTPTPSTDTSTPTSGTPTVTPGTPTPASATPTPGILTATPGTPPPASGTPTAPAGDPTASTGTPTRAASTPTPATASPSPTVPVL